MSITEISIIITSFQSEDKINACLNSINNLCQVIIVENSNNLEFKKNIERKFSNVNCILTGENLGYGKANNIGLKKAKTKYALILNPDATLESSALENFLQEARKNPDFAIMGPYVQKKKEENKKIDIKNSIPVKVNNVKGFAMFLNLSEFKNIGFFDERFFIYFEEIDLCKRLIEHGKKIFLVPSIQIKHDGGKSHNKTINREMELSRNWHWMWSSFNYHKKYKGFFISLLILFPKLSSAIFKVLFYSLFVNKEKKEIYYYRYSGLINAILGKNSWYRPKV